MTNAVPSPRFYRPQTKFAKVMFSQVSVCPQLGGVADTPRQTPPGQTPTGQTHLPRQTPPWADTPPVITGIRSTSGRYASNWNAFLFYLNFRLYCRGTHDHYVGLDSSWFSFHRQSFYESLSESQTGKFPV